MSGPKPTARQIRLAPANDDDTTDDDDGVWGKFKALSAEDPKRPLIAITVELADVITNTSNALANNPDVYVRNAQLVRVTQAKATDKATKSKRVVVGTPQVWPMSAPALCDELTNTTRFAKWDVKSEDWKRTLPSQPLLQGLHARRSWPGLRNLIGVIETPSMRPDGSIIDCPGWDAETGYLYDPSVEFPPIPTAPTQADARKALTELMEPFLDFPFATEAAKYVAIAALLTIIARPAIAGCVPAFVFDAPTPGTGKTLCADALCTIATGRTSPRGTFPTDPSELEKILSSHALQATSVVGFDNLSTGFGGASLDKCLTAIADVDFRILGKTESPRLPWTAVVLASGNNVPIVGDTARRVLIASLASDMEKPEDREGFKHPELLTWIGSERPRLVVAALTILRAYVVAGRPNVGVKTWGSYEPFTKVVASAIVFAGGANVLNARCNADTVGDGGRSLGRSILEGFTQMDPGAKGRTARNAVDMLYPYYPDGKRPPPDGLDYLREAIEVLTCTPSGKIPDANKLGIQLGKLQKRVIDGKRLIGFTDKHKKVTVWVVEVVAITPTPPTAPRPTVRTANAQPLEPVDPMGDDAWPADEPFTRRSFNDVV